MKYISHYESPLGAITLAAAYGGLCGLWFDGQRYDRAVLKNDTVSEDNLPVFAEVQQWLDIYFSGRDPGFTPKLTLLGSDFRNLVAEIMLSIPYGGLMTYGEIASAAADRLGKTHMSAQAVGGAVGHNPISLIVPCHRVVGTGGSLTGYGGGIRRKEWLLEHEGISLAAHGLYVPATGTAL